jgi:uncharacterized membrane protein
MEYLWSHWIFVAFLAPFYWALVNIIDVYFVSSVYEDEWDGIFINSVFQLFPWLLPIFGVVSFQYPGVSATIIALLGGASLILAFFFYFKTLFIFSDVAVIQAIWNLSVPLVPFLSWLLLSEKLLPVHYGGIALAFAGAMLFLTHKEVRAKNFLGVAKTMVGAVTLFSLSMVLQSRAYDLMGNDFWTGFLIFSAGAGITGLALAFFDPKTVKSRSRHLLQMTRTYFFIFFVAESLNLLAVLSSQRAIDLSPVVSFVAVIESSVPIFVMLMSLALIPILLMFNKDKVHQIYQDQLVAFKTKIVACSMIAGGIYLIS